jgi:hypothetical protein
MDVASYFVITWQDYRNTNWDIYFQRYNDAGTTLGVNTKVNDDAGSMHQLVPSISMDVTGNFVIVWEDNRYGQTSPDIIGQRYFSNGNPNGGNYSIITDGPNSGETTPAVCADNSSIIFSWQDDRLSNGWDIYAKIVNWNWNGVTALIDEGNINPIDFSLSQNYPNPFNPSTNIKFAISDFGFVNLKVYDVLGNEVATLVEKEMPAGEYEVEFNSHSGLSGIKELTSGVYFYQLQAGNFIQTKKMLFLK